MVISANGRQFMLAVLYNRQNVWIPFPEPQEEAGKERRNLTYCSDGIRCSLLLSPEKEGVVGYSLLLEADFPSAVRLMFCPADRAAGSEAFHVIPCNIFGDNNAAEVTPGEMPLLTRLHPEVSYCSPFWEFRADRAAMPLSCLLMDGFAAAVSVDPYSDAEGGYIHNGLFSGLPDTFGISLGYTNDPCTMQLKRMPAPSTYERARSASVSGRIYCVPCDKRTGLHRIIRAEYELRHERAVYRKTWKDAAEGLLKSFVEINWNEKDGEYTNVKCCPPGDPVMKPWRNVMEIGWTGGGVLSYPLILTRDVLGSRADELLSKAMSGEEMNDRITDCYNEPSGLYLDLMSELDGSRVNGWWTGFGLVKDCHCAYTNGSALHYILKSVHYLRGAGKHYPEQWLTTALKVMDTVIELQRTDGAFGYTYAVDRKQVLDWEGFAGCWFAAAAAYAYELTGDRKYLTAADQAVRYYHTFVENLCCSGTPMDTWKSVDEEGNLAFIRACRILHGTTKETLYLDYLRDGADYEFLWRYGYRARPEYVPLKADCSGWNSCGGSVTSVSNPHIHPMGSIVNSDLLYLGRVSGDDYYTSRALDGIAWIMQTLELYPEKTGYGAYGVLSERWCPSDGLTIERYSDGKPYSSWFSYNLWAAADALEDVCERYLDI